MLQNQQNLVTVKQGLDTKQCTFHILLTSKIDTEKIVLVEYRRSGRHESVFFNM